MIVLAAAVATIVFFAVGLLILSSAGNDENGNETFSTIQDADSIYRAAASAVDSESDLVLALTQTQETSISNAVFLEISRQTLSCTGRNTSDIRASVEETFRIDNHSISISEYFAGGTAYTTVDGSSFSSSISAEEYCSRFAPAVLLDAALYQSIHGTDTGQGYIITFEQPSGAEAWSLTEGSVFVDASGTAYVSYDGMLTKSTYAITYMRGDATIRLTVTAEPECTTPEITAPTNPAAYMPIDFLDGPRMLEQASGYLLQADNVSATYTDSLYFQAFGDRRTQTINLYTHKEDLWSALMKTTVSLSNTSREGEVSGLSQTELFFDNAYHISVNEAEAAVNPEIDVDTMHSYCQDLLVGTVMLPQYITGSVISETDDTWLVTFTGDDTFAGLISSDACNTLYQKPELLYELSQSHSTDTLQCYIELDKNTGLPVASGICFSGTYTMENLPYQLHFKADQDYDLLSTSTYSQIKEAAGA